MFAGKELERRKMARSRNIKPSFFKNEILGVADPLLSLLFASLWTLADRQGRLEDRPLRIKAETFPYREIPDFNGYLTQLEQHGFIDRYKVGDLAIIQVVSFRKHQAPHNTEKASELPEKPMELPITVKPPLPTAGLTQAKRPDSLNLIPDSLIPDSPKKPSSEYSAEFLKFWEAWPTSPRKGGRPGCYKIWKSKNFDADCETIIAHVESQKNGSSWKDTQYIPAPSVYLGQARWDGAETQQSGGNDSFLRRIGAIPA